MLNLLSAQPRIHKHQKYSFNFRLKPQPLASSLDALIGSRRFRSIDTGGLYTYVMDKLDSVTGLVNKVDFTLVNVLAPAIRASAGFNPTPPPESVLPNASSRLVFTFAFSRDTSFETQDGYNKRFRSAFVNLFNTKFSARVQFVNVGVDLVTAKKVGCASLLWDDVRYLYWAIGMMTKSAVRTLPLSDWVGTPFVIETPDRWSEYRRINNYNLAALANRVPFSKWAFNEDLLDRAPNLLTPMHITPEFVQYVMLKGLTPDLSGSTHSILLGHINSAIREFVMLVNQPTNEFTLEQTTIPLLLAALNDTTYLGNPASLEPNGYPQWVYDRLQSHSEAVTSYLTPFHQTAQEMALGDYSRLGPISGLLYL